MPPLARVVDVAEAQSRRGPSARAAFAVPHGWLAEGALLEVELPTLVACFACDGGGCDGCARSGAHRLAESPDARTVRVALPRTQAPGLALRLVEPLGPHGGLDVVVLEFRGGDSPSSTCRRVPEAVSRDRPAPSWGPLVALALALALASALAWGR